MSVCVILCVFPSRRRDTFLHTYTYTAHRRRRGEERKERRGASFVTREVAVECVVCVFVKETEMCLCEF